MVQSWAIHLWNAVWVAVCIILQFKPNTPKTSKEQYGKSMCQIQAAVAMEQQKMRLDITTTAAGLYRASHKSGIKLTSSEHPRRTFIQAPTQSIFKILMPGHLEDFSTGSPQDLLKDLYEIMQGPTGFHPGLFKSFSQGLHKIMQRPDGISQGSPQDPFRRACKRRWPRSSGQNPYKNVTRPSQRSGSYKILTQEPLRSLPQ